MWYPPLRSRQAWIIVERMTQTFSDALENDADAIDRVAILRDIAAALAHLHDRGIVHRDVKPANILLNEDGTQAKLADFGNSRRRSSNATMTVETQQAGTPFYMAPEVRQSPRCKTTPQIDCWAFELLICEVVNPTEHSAFVGAHHADLHGAALAWAGGIRDKTVMVAAMACVQHDSKGRPDMREMYLHLAGAVAMEPVLQRRSSSPPVAVSSGSQCPTVRTNQPPTTNTNKPTNQPRGPSPYPYRIRTSPSTSVRFRRT